MRDIEGLGIYDIEGIYKEGREHLYSKQRPKKSEDEEYNIIDKIYNTSWSALMERTGMNYR